MIKNKCSSKKMDSDVVNCCSPMLGIGDPMNYSFSDTECFANGFKLGDIVEMTEDRILVHVLPPSGVEYKYDIEFELIK